jgi:hypothetical protein
MDLPQSDDCFVMAFPAENTESFLEGHNQAFAYFGGVPRTMRFCRKHPGSGFDSVSGDAEDQFAFGLTVSGNFHRAGGQLFWAASVRPSIRTSL